MSSLKLVLQQEEVVCCRDSDDVFVRVPERKKERRIQIVGGRMKKEMLENSNLKIDGEQIS
jgi:hypothetical protein